MKIFVFTCFTIIFLFNSQAKSETLIVRIIQNHKKNLSLNYGFESIKFEKKSTLSRQDFFIEKSMETVENVFKIDKDKINESKKFIDKVKMFMPIGRDSLIILGKPNYDLNKNRSDDNKLENQNLNFRQRGNRGFMIKVLSIYF